MIHVLPKPLLALCLLGLVQTTAVAQDSGITDPENLWKFCVFCHSPDGLGTERFDAPKIAGDPAWYTERQLTNFRARIRGSHPEDQPGLQMFVYSYPLIDEAAIWNMAAFIEALPVSPQNPRPDRMRNRPRNRPYEWDSQFARSETGTAPDAERGQSLFAECARCHGETGEGLAAMNGPRLDNKQDWYLIRQLKYFMYGARGAHKDDIYGRQMAELSGLESDQDIVDVVAYISTLSKGPMY
ncbi:MAG: c-type cytochrome [Pseudomonadota bacterium]